MRRRYNGQEISLRDDISDEISQALADGISDADQPELSQTVESWISSKGFSSLVDTLVSRVEEHLKVVIE